MSVYTSMRALREWRAPGGRQAIYYGAAILLGGLVGAMAFLVPPLYILLGVGGFFFLCLLILNMELAVVVALLLLETLRNYNSLGGGSPFHPNGLMGLSLIFGAVWGFSFAKVDFSRLVAAKYFLAFLVVCFISLLFADGNWFEGLTIVLRLASGFAIYAVLVYKTNSIRDIVLVIGAILIALIWPTVVDLVLIAQGKGTSFLQMGTARLGGGSSGPGVYLAMILSFCVVFLFEARTNGRRLLWGSLCIIFLVGLFYSYGRAGWIGFALGLFMLATVKYKRLWFLLPGLILVAILALPQLSERFSDISIAQLGNRHSSTVAARLQIWTAGLAVFREHNPVFGVGYGVERYRIGEYLAQYPWMAHNDYIGVLVGTGLIGLILFLLWHGQWLVKLAEIYRKSVFEFDKTLSLATFNLLFVSMIVRFSDNLVETTGRLYPLVALVAITLALPRIRAEQAARAEAAVASGKPSALSKEAL